MSETGETRASKSGKKEIETGRKDASIKREGFRSRFLETLLTKKEEVEAALNRLMDVKREYKDLVSEDVIIEELDHAEREIEIQKHYSLLERKHRELEKIEYLIQRIQEEDEEFGRCEECGRRIREERLLIVPDATRCVPCQKEIEKFDSSRSLAERSYTPAGMKKDLRWEEKEEANDEGESLIKPDIEQLSIVDLDETDIDNNMNNK